MIVLNPAAPDQPLVDAMRAWRLGTATIADVRAVFARTEVYAPQHRRYGNTPLGWKQTSLGKVVLVYTTVQRLELAAGRCQWLATTGADIAHIISTDLPTDVTAVMVDPYDPHRVHFPVAELASGSATRTTATRGTS